MSFDQISGISFSTIAQESLIKVVIQTSSAPKIQSRPLKVPDGQSPCMTFEIRASDVFRFKQALRSRGVVRLFNMAWVSSVDLGLSHRRERSIYRLVKRVPDWSLIERVTLFRRS